MKSQTSLTARNYRLNEWNQMVESCKNRPIGMSVDEWCQENSITKANYYYRMTQVRKACLDSLPKENVEQTVVPVPKELMIPEEESCEQVPTQPNAEDAFLELTFHGATIRVTDQTSKNLLAKVLEVLTHVE